MGKRLDAAMKEVDVNKAYPPSEAIALAKKTATTTKKTVPAKKKAPVKKKRRK